VDDLFGNIQQIYDLAVIMNGILNERLNSFEAAQQPFGRHFSKVVRKIIRLVRSTL